MKKSTAELGSDEVRAPGDRSEAMPPIRVSAQGTGGAHPGLVDAPDPDPDDAAATPADPDDLVDEWGRQSFPASDPPANW